MRHAARELTGADGATFVLRDGERCYYLDEDAIGPLWKGQRFPLSDCISGWAMQHRVPAVIEDIYTDPRIPTDVYRPTFVKSLVMVPIRAEAPIGAIGNYWASHHRASEREVELLQALANTTAVAMENVQVYRELERRVRERTSQLEAANQELEAFSYSVSHDLRGPLHNVAGYTQMLEDRYASGLDAGFGELVEQLRNECGRMNGLIGDLLRLAQIARCELGIAPVDLSEMADEIATRLRTSAPEREAEIVIPAGLVAPGDAGLLRLALENLLANAWKFSAAAAPHARIELGSAAQADGSTAYFVRDNGLGFDMAEADEVFTAFHRLPSAAAFPGSGVGLATVQRIIHRHGGRIWVESAPSRGSTFWFTLGAAEAPVADFARR